MAPLCLPPRPNRFFELPFSGESLRWLQQRVWRRANVPKWKLCAAMWRRNNKLQRTMCEPGYQRELGERTDDACSPDFQPSVFPFMSLFTSLSSPIHGRLLPSCLEFRSSDFRIQANNCGGCGNACGGGQTCQNGNCVLQCGDGMTNCNGQCVNLATNVGLFG